MSRRPQRPLNEELAELERTLAALTIQVAHLRTQANQNAAEAPPPPPRPRRTTPTIGDRVRFHIVGRGYTEGVIFGTTRHRVQIRQDTTNFVFSRAPHNVIII
jgi:hypothetical protein